MSHRKVVDKDLVTVVIDAKAISQQHPRLPALLVRGIAVEFGEEASAVLSVHFWEKWGQRVECDFRITGVVDPDERNDFDSEGLRQTGH